MRGNPTHIHTGSNISYHIIYDFGLLKKKTTQHNTIQYRWIHLVDRPDDRISHGFLSFVLQYKTERDGVVETRVEQKITIQSDGDPIDHDRALAEAIQEATAMNPDMTVEKIEIQQQTGQ